MTESKPTILMNEEAVQGAVDRMSGEILAFQDDGDMPILMGIQRRGVHLAAMIRDKLRGRTDADVPMGTLDITLYRDDLMAIGPRPIVGESTLPVSGVDERTVVIVDDVLYTGRTVRAALNELMDWGRPARILLCVLIDRGERELPIQPDVVGELIEVAPGQRVDFLVPDLDGRLAVEIRTREDD